MSLDAVRRAIAALALLSLPLTADASSKDLDPDVAQAEAKAVVRETLDAVVEVLKDSSLSPEQKQKRTEEIAYARFDFDTITRLVLARNWKRLSQKQRSDFVVEFRRHLSLTYGEALQSYEDEKISIYRSRFEKNGDVMVRTRIVGASADAVLVDYRLRKKEASWSVIDVITEGVSLISNFRSQTKEIISEIGPGGLIKRLRQKNAERESKNAEREPKG
jgi:phospholipid transport system substrate-binding protein